MATIISESDALKPCSKLWALYRDLPGGKSIKYFYDLDSAMESFKRAREMKNTWDEIGLLPNVVELYETEASWRSL